MKCCKRAPSDQDQTVRTQRPESVQHRARPGTAGAAEAALRHQVSLENMDCSYDLLRLHLSGAYSSQ